MTGTCTGCGDYQSGDPSGKCWECRIAEPGYRARLDATVRKGIAAEYAAHPEWRQTRPESGDPGPYRFFYAEVIRKECPGCGWATAAGFTTRTTRAPRPGSQRNALSAQPGISRPGYVPKQRPGTRTRSRIRPNRNPT